MRIGICKMLVINHGVKEKPS